MKAIVTRKQALSPGLWESENVNLSDVFLRHSDQVLILLVGGIVREIHGNLDVFGGGSAVEQVKGRALTDFMTAEAARRFIAFLSRQEPSGPPNAELCDVQLTLENGKNAKLRLKVVPVNDKRFGDGMALIGTEISREARLERQLARSRRMEALGTLAGGIAHDFNNILMGVIGYSDMALDETVEGDDLHRYMEHVICGAYRARDLVRQLLNFTHRSESEEGAVTLNALLKGVGKSLKSSTGSAIAVGYKIDDTPLPLKNGPEDVEAVLITVCDTLIDVLGEGGGELQLHLMSETLEKNSELVLDLGLAPQPYGVVHVAIRRTGGEEVSPADYGVVIGEIFERLSRLGGAVMTGRMEDGHPCIALWLPLVVRLANRRGVRGVEGVKGSGRILFVDDEKMLVAMVGRMLTGLGYQVETTTDGGEALEMVRRSPERFDLVITDHIMPSLTGLELAERMIEVRHDLPIIMLTAYSEKVTERQAEAAGIRRYVLKPVERSEFSRIIHEVLAESAMSDGSNGK